MILFQKICENAFLVDLQFSDYAWNVVFLSFDVNFKEVEHMLVITCAAYANQFYWYSQINEYRYIKMVHLLTWDSWVPKVACPASTHFTRICCNNTGFGHDIPTDVKLLSVSTFLIFETLQINSLNLHNAVCIMYIRGLVYWCLIYYESS